jgi:RimJ/RimL family protein N-acetyltransferase
MTPSIDIDHIAGQSIGSRVDATPAKRPSCVILPGRYVTVCPIDPDRDYKDLYDGTHGPDGERLWLYMSEGPFPDLASFRAYLVKCAASQDPLSFAIIDERSGRAAGHASYMRIATDHRVIEVGNIFYSRYLQRSTGATEAMFLMAKHAFEDLGYRRYEWKCNALNEPSRNAALRLGFTFEGVFRHHMIQKQRSRDTAWYAMLECEWPSRKAGFERWLRPDNFTDDGCQRSRLTFDA